MINGKIYDKIM